MNKKYLYYLAVFGLLMARVLILNTNFPTWLHGVRLEKLAHFCVMLRENGYFLHFIGGWTLPVFVFAVIIYWLTEEDEDRIPLQFFVLPIAYLPFTIIGDTLVNANFNFANLYLHPMIVLPFGYIYVLGWAAFIWVLRRIRLAP